MNSKMFLTVGVLMALAFELQASPIVTMKNMVWKWGKKTRIECTADNTKKISNDSGTESAGISAPPCPVVAGTTCNVSFEARGDVKMESQVMWSSKGKENIGKHFIKATCLSDEWQSFSGKVTVPKGKNTAAFALYFYRQSGWMEIRNFTVEAENASLAEPAK